MKYTTACEQHQLKAPLMSLKFCTRSNWLGSIKQYPSNIKHSNGVSLKYQANTQYNAHLLLIASGAYAWN